MFAEPVQVARIEVTRIAIFADTREEVHQVFTRMYPLYP